MALCVKRELFFIFPKYNSYACICILCIKQFENEIIFINYLSFGCGKQSEIKIDSKSMHLNRILRKFEFQKYNQFLYKNLIYYTLKKKRTSKKKLTLCMGACFL